jgi:hypothetical protein
MLTSMAYSGFGTRRFSLFLLLLLLISLVAGVGMPLSMHAQEDVTVSITGSFYRQNPSIPQGSGISGPSIYVIVTNAGENDVQIVMVSETPDDGVTIGFDRGTFVLTPQQQQKVQIRVDVAETVPAGEYPDSLVVSGQVYRTGQGGPVASASGAQRTSLTVSGDSANVGVSTVAPSGQPVVSQIRLFRMVGDTGYEMAYSNTGTLQAKVVPGTFTAEAYSVKPGGGKLCEPNTFDVTAGEDKTVTLTVRMVYFEDDFVVSPNYDSETKKLLSTLTNATLTNVYDTIAGTVVVLQVTFNGDPLEEITVLGPLPLPLSQTGVQWNYIPAEGWRNGLYGFRYQLYVDGLLTAETQVETLKVGRAGIASWLWIIFVFLGILGTAGLGFLIFFLLKRRKKGEKPEKAEKKERKKKEEKPAPKAVEPVRKPEPYRPPEPVRPVQPVRYEEPTVEPTAEPATLSTVSTLKARMASMGRDQGTGKPAEEEPDTEKKDEPVETGPLASQPAPVPPPPKIEPERPAVKKVEDKGHKLPASEKPAGHKPGIFSKVTATGKKEPPKPPVAQGPAPVKPGDEVTINWPPKTVEPPKPPGDVQINWPPKPVEPPKPSALEEAARQRVEAQQHVVAPEEAAPEEEGATEEPSEPQVPPSRSSFSEAARLRMEARQRASEKGKTGAGPGESQTEGDAKSGSGEGDNRPPSP